MYSELKKIIDNNSIKTVFQPIVSLKNAEVIGYEALSRGPSDTVYRNPEIMFAEAKKEGLLWELELKCRVNAIKRFKLFNADKSLFLNVDPNIIKDEHFIKGFTKEFLNDNTLDPSLLVFEITEKSSIADYNQFNNIIENYKSQGYRIAIDDVGTGYSGLNTIAETKPGFIKLDRNLISEIDKDNYKKALIKAFVQFAKTSNVKIIAEGIETIEELNELMDMGVDYGQGYLLHVPAEDLSDVDDEIKNIIIDKNHYIDRITIGMSSTVKIGEIAKHGPIVYVNTPASKVEDMFVKNQKLQGIVVVNECNKVVGLVMRTKFFSKIGTQYGWALYINKPIYKLMDKEILIVDYNTTIDITSRAVTSRDEDKSYDCIVVIKNEHYYGTVQVISLLENIMQMELNIAKYSNPLTGLPGNIIIEEKMKTLLKEKRDFSILYFDLNDFKAYNDRYGFEYGDKIILSTAKIIQRHINSVEKGFLGHIGGDDFVGIVENWNIDKLCGNICEEFDRNIAKYYNQEDLDNGYICSSDRYGKKCCFNIMSISVAILRSKDNDYDNPMELAKKMAEIKKKCKNMSKKSFKSIYLAV